MRPQFLQSPPPSLSPPPSPPPNFVFKPPMPEFLYLLAAAALISLFWIFFYFRAVNRENVETESDIENQNTDSPLTNPHQVVPSAAVIQKKLAAIKKLLPTSYIDGNNLDEETENYTTDSECAICLEEFRVGDEFKVLPDCRHRFHAFCIDYWLFEKNSCPVCRNMAIDFNNL